MEYIKIEALSYEIGERSILKDIDLSAEQKRFVGLIGPNGSGKTTLLKHLYNAVRAKKKTVFINSKGIEEYSQKELAREVTVMKQENLSAFDYCVFDMVLMGRAPYRNTYEEYTEDDERRARRALEYVGMERYAEQSYQSLSGGEKQRVLIARSLTQDTEVLVLDEPTNHLDIYYQMFLMQLIRGLKKTVISVFHDLNLAFKFCDYVYVLKDGEIRAAGAPKDVLTEEMIREVFRLDSQIIRDSNGTSILYRGACPVENIT